LPDDHPIIRIKKFCPDWTEFQNHPTSVQLGQKYREIRPLANLARSHHKEKETARQIALQGICRAIWKFAADAGKSYNICVDGR